MFSAGGLLLFLLCSISRAKLRRETPDGKHHLCPARDAKVDRLCARAVTAQSDASTLGGSARSAQLERLDRRAGQAEAGRAGQPPDIKAGRLCRTSRLDQTSRRSRRVLSRQGAYVKVDRREQVKLGRSCVDRDYFNRSTTDAPLDLASAIRLDWILDVNTELNVPMGVRSSQT